MPEPVRVDGFGPRLKRLMRRRGFTVRTLAKESGVSPATIDRWRSQENWPPRSLDFWRSFATVLRCSVDEIAPREFFDEEERGAEMDVTRLPSHRINPQDDQFLDLALEDTFDTIAKISDTVKELRTRLQRIQKARSSRKGAVPR